MAVAVGVGVISGSVSATACQSTPPPLLALSAYSAGSVPSARIVQTCPPWSHAIRDPSGENAGLRWAVPDTVTCAWPEPSALMAQMCVGPVVREKAIRVPSGDHDGSTLVTPGSVCVRLRSSVPSASIAQMSELSSRGVSNTIVAPSGDQAGSVSAASCSVSAEAVPAPSAAVT